MNILMLTAYPPVLHMHGGGVRMYHNIRILGKKHRVHVISFVENDEQRELLNSLRDICESIVAVRRIPDFRPHWLSLDPFLLREFKTPEMFQAVDAALRQRRIDVMQCEYLQMSQYRKRGVFSVLTIHETLSANAYDSFQKATDPALKLKLFYRWMQMLRCEVGATRRFDRVVTMTGHDANYLRSYSPRVDLRPIPIGIDPEEFKPAPETDGPLEVLFLGNFRHTPNVEAAGFLIREIAPSFPGIRFRIPGDHIPDDFPRPSHVEFPGYIADTRVLYHGSRTIVATPLFSGTGQRVKLLEAFSSGCPVITTTVGALGFPIRNGEEALIADTADSFRAATAALVESQALRRRLGECGREMIVRRFSWNSIGQDLLNVVEEGVESSVDV